MAGAALYARAEASALFVNEPLLRCSDGRWRIANPVKRPWDGTPEVERLGGSGWEPLDVSEAHVAAGTVAVEEEPGRLRATGRFFPLTLLGEAGSWRLEAAFAAGVRGLGGSVAGAGRLAGATVVLSEFELDPEAELSGPLFAVLAAAGGEYACLAMAGRGGDSREVRLSVPGGGLAFAAS